eukprot:6772770-Prymnesium_polylepis.2
MKARRGRSRCRAVPRWPLHTSSDRLPSEATHPAWCAPQSPIGDVAYNEYAKLCEQIPGLHATHNTRFAHLQSNANPEHAAPKSELPLAHATAGTRGTLTMPPSIP